MESFYSFTANLSIFVQIQVLLLHKGCFPMETDMSSGKQIVIVVQHAEYDSIEHMSLVLSFYFS